jgi:hypothetical protein
MLMNQTPGGFPGPKLSRVLAGRVGARGVHAMAVKLALTVALAVVLLTTVAWGQTLEQFRVTWEPRTHALPSSIAGHVYNDSSFRVTDVQLQVEGLDGDDRPVGRTFAWAIGDIVPDGETSFVVETIPGAVNYRITVYSFDVVSGIERR